MGEGGRSSREENSRTIVSRRKRWEAQENLTKVGSRSCIVRKNEGVEKSNINGV